VFVGDGGEVGVDDDDDGGKCNRNFWEELIAEVQVQ
jgi:hypothetical protein